MYGQPCGAQRLSAVTPLFQYIPCRRKRCRKPPGLVFFSVRTAASRVPFFLLLRVLLSPKGKDAPFYALHSAEELRSYCPEIPCQTQSLPAEFLNNLPKNPAAHLTHKLCAVSPLFLFFTAYFFFSLSDSQQHAQRRHGQKDAVPCPFQLQKE